MRPEILAYAADVASLGRDVIRFRKSQAVRSKANNPLRFLWDQAKRLYRRVTGGQPEVIPQPVLREAIDGFGANAKVELLALAYRFQDGEINDSHFAIEARKLLKSLHLAAGMAAIGGKANLTPAILGKIGSLIKSEMAYFNAMMREIGAGTQPLDGRFLARVGMYATAATKTYEAVRRSEVIAAGVMTEERRVTNNPRACGDCVRYAGRGWVKIGSKPRLPDIGHQCQCCSNCLCWFEYK